MTRPRTLIGMVVAVGCLYAVVAVLGQRKELPGIAKAPTSAELEREIRLELPIGSSLLAVERLLARRNMEFSFQASSNSILAIVRGLPDGTYVVHTSLQLEFRFDDASNLKAIDTKVLYTGP